jgi:hypothetical protein
VPFSFWNDISELNQVLESSDNLMVAIAETYSILKVGAKSVTEP